MKPDASSPRYRTTRVVTLTDRVEFVVVTASAGNGQAECGFGNDIDLIVGKFDEFIE